LCLDRATQRRISSAADLATVSPVDNLTVRPDHDVPRVHISVQYGQAIAPLSHWKCPDDATEPRSRDPLESVFSVQSVELFEHHGVTIQWD
jgi:hypothetical protein